ncbi:MAG: hypothetical protein US42_C0011G0053 [Candidatus Magasanikbacteria bacterium GW2011_GWC2_37_14]|uniref:DUF3592 domain-containing protein n=1 Tax=Candidatus Magasanikbacteria bacterium GW2011_GWC2_37_14 TaxID=1619046 RepID=A0A0G0GMC9_9BACT|nr:MAG: hypothetical protein US42_C0011G0053 [Candidatus Magasanikbacteria bacterium GW2011_GWC2_37_14]
MKVTSKVSLIVNIFVVFFGLAIFILGILLIKHSIFVEETFQTATGTIYNIKTEPLGVDLPGSYLDYLQIEFSLPSGEKIRFTNDYNQENVKYKIGDTLPIYYNPEKPENAYIADYRFLFITGGVCLLMGVAFMIFAGQYVIKKSSRKKIIANIKRTGTKIQVPLLEVKEDLETTIMEKHPFIISVKKEDGNILYSDEIWNYNPQKLQPGQMIDVYFDVQKPADYYIDVEFLNEE